MKTKWGSCTPASRRVWLNSELAKKPVECIEYIVVHELLHLAESNHGERFVALMNRHLPRWAATQKRLNAAPLGHEDWGSTRTSLALRPQGGTAAIMHPMSAIRPITAARSGWRWRKPSA